MSWLHRPSNPISLSLSINLTDNNGKTNRFYSLIKAWLARLKKRWRRFLRRSRDAIVNSASSTRQSFEAKPHQLVNRTRSALPCKLERPEDYTSVEAASGYRALR
jgi:hypothetical protein